MIDYFIKAIAFQVLFLAIYDLLLKKETFFQWNRFYLIVTTVLSYSIPLIRIGGANAVLPEEYIIALPEVVLYPSKVIEQSTKEPEQIFNYLRIGYWIGFTMTALFFLIKLFKLRAMIRKNIKQKINHYFLVSLNGNNAFSFFNYIFLGDGVSEKSKARIIEHELVHVKQKHSLDLLFFELQKILCWFNPMSYVYQQRIKELHEFIADAHSVKRTELATYFNDLLSETFGVNTFSFINPFFKHSLIKKRIVMLNKNRSKQLLKFKYLLLLPLLAGMLLYASCEKNTKNEPIIAKNEKRAIKVYSKNPDNGEVIVKELKGESYFDTYLDGAKPESGKEVSYFDLTPEEQTDFQLYVKPPKDRNERIAWKIFEMKDGRKVLYYDINDSDEVPFAMIEKAPVFPGCENTEDPKTCIQEKISDFVQQNYNTSQANDLGLEPGKKRVYVQFTIDKEGNATDIKARGPYKVLEDEAVRVIQSLPKMTPGTQNGKKVNVTYTLPISLMIN